MSGINGGKMIVLVLIALFLIGPERLPGYAEQLKSFVKKAKRCATGAIAELKETLGSDVADVDWKKLDPRQYDPRTIVRQALLEDDDEAAAEHRTQITDEEQRRADEQRQWHERVQREQHEHPEPLSSGSTSAQVLVASTVMAHEPAMAGLGAGAPFDAEAT